MRAARTSGEKPGNKKNREGRSAVVTSNHALPGGASPCHLASREFSETGLFDQSYKGEETRIPP